MCQLSPHETSTPTKAAKTQPNPPDYPPLSLYVLLDHYPPLYIHPYIAVFAFAICFAGNHVAYANRSSRQGLALLCWH